LSTRAIRDYSSCRPGATRPTTGRTLLCNSRKSFQVNRIRHGFKWAVGDEIVPGSVLYALQAVPGLRRGRSDAYEPEAVKPVPMERVEAIQPFVSRQAWAMVHLQIHRRPSKRPPAAGRKKTRRARISPETVRLHAVFRNPIHGLVLKRPSVAGFEAPCDTATLTAPAGGDGVPLAQRKGEQTRIPGTPSRRPR